MKHFAHLADMQAAVGQEIGVSDWLLVDQHRIDLFAQATGGPESSYRPDGSNRHFFGAYLHPYEQTAALVHMRWLPPLVLHGAHLVDEPTLAAHARLFAQRLASWPESAGWPDLAGLAPTPVCDVPADTRPQG